jgi:hypothetical protein
MTSTSHTLELLLLALQAFQVAFLWTHDWIPLGRLNDVAAVRRQDPLPRLIQDPLPRLIIVTLIQSVPFTIGLIFSAKFLGHAYPHWLTNWLWISYSILFIGQLRAWWLPYLLRPEPERAARYQHMFGNTHSFLPHRNGLVPNTAHIALHLATAATLVVLLIEALKPIPAH